MSPVVLAAIAAWQVVACPTLEAWLAARHQFLTASDVAAVLGMHPHKSRNAVLKDKRTPFQPPKPGAGRGARAMRAGQFLEPAVLEWFADDCHAAEQAAGLSPLKGWAQCRDPGGTSLLVRYADPDLRLAASPDGVLVFERGTDLVEVKVHGPRQWALWDEPSRSRAWTGARLGVPLQHWVQLQTQLLCTGEDRGWVVGNCGSERKEQQFDADVSFQGRIIDATAAFWREVG